MTENERIKKHIEDCEHRIGNILGFMESNSDANTSSCEENISVLKTVIIALEEIKQYRALEQKLQSVYGEHGGLLEIIVNGLVRYENAPDKAIKAVLLTDDDVEKWEQLKAIGTIDEFKALKEKNTPYKPQEYEDRYYACKCDNILLPKWRKYPTELMPKSEGLPHCMACGQKLDWSE